MKNTVALRFKGYQNKCDIRYFRLMWLGRPLIDSSGPLPSLDMRRLSYTKITSTNVPCDKPPAPSGIHINRKPRETICPI